MQNRDHMEQNKKRYTHTSMYLHRYFRHFSKSPDIGFGDENLNLFLNENNFSLIKNRARLDHIVNHSHIIHKRKLMRSELKVLLYKGRPYLYINDKNFSILLIDQKKQKFSWSIFIWYLIALGFIAWLYLWLTMSLRPLKNLQKQIEEVVDGDLTISVKSDKDDEIAQVANAFDDALRKLESLINSRQLFLRSIMHELKTPIGKGKLLNEFLIDSSQKDRYGAVFERLELLIEEFSKIEKMLSSSYDAKLASYNARDIVEQSLELMIMDEDEIDNRVTISQESVYIIHTDFEMLALAIKNLIDNAIKYSTDSHVNISISKHGIRLTNKGAKFTDTITSYAEPFHSKSHGLGLGLYIVLNIVEMLSLKLDYSYQDAEHSFWIRER